MNTSLVSEDGLKRKLEFTVPKENVIESFSKNFEKHQKDAQIHGFRKGKAPQEKIKEAYRGKVWQVVLDSLFQNFYPKVIKEHNLNPAGRPKLIDVKLTEEEPCTFTIEVEVHPEVKIKQYKKLKVKKQELQVTDEKVEETVKNLRNSFAASKNKEGNKEGGELPEMNEEFLSRFKVKTADELKEKIRKDLKALNEQKIKEKIENDIIEKLVESNPVTLPESLLEEQKESLKKNAQKRLEDYGIKGAAQEKWLKERNAEFEKEARLSVHSSYLIETLITDLKIKPTEEDIDQSLKESFPTKTPEEMKKDLQKGNYWNHFIFNLTRKKVIDHLVKEADIS